MLTALSYAEMATSFPVAGAEYVYLRKAWPGADWLAFSVGSILLLGGAATAATVAMAFAGYLRVFVDVPAIAAAGLLLAFCTALGIWGLRESSWLNIAFTLIEVAGLLMVVAAALWSDIRLPSQPAGAEPAVLAAAALLFFVYLGFEEVANLAEEVRDPASRPTDGSFRQFRGHNGTVCDGRDGCGQHCSNRRPGRQRSSSGHGH